MAAPIKTRKKAPWKEKGKPGRPKESRQIIMNELTIKGPDPFEELLKRTKLSRKVFSDEIRKMEKDGLIDREPLPLKEGRGRHRLLIKLSAKADSPAERIIRNMKSLIPPPESLTVGEESKLRELLTDDVIKAMKEIYINYRRLPKWLERENPVLFKKYQMLYPLETSSFASFLISVTIFDLEYDQLKRSGERKWNNLLKISNSLQLLASRKLINEFLQIHQLSSPIFHKCDKIVVEFITLLRFQLTINSTLSNQSTGKKSEMKKHEE